MRQGDSKRSKRFKLVSREILTGCEWGPSYVEGVEIILKQGLFKGVNCRGRDCFRGVTLGRRMAAVDFGDSGYGFGVHSCKSAK